MSLIAIGDIHGCVETLEVLLERMNLRKDDHLVFVGDYIDRGPDSKGVIDLLLDLEDDVHCTFLRGNHEALMLGYLDTGEFELWSMNGGTETLLSYRDVDNQIRIPEEHIAFIRRTPLFLDTNDYFFVHGGIPPDVSISRAKETLTEDTYLWERAHLGARRRNWEKVVVCGHTPRPTPLNEPDLIAIDTGCVYHARPGLGTLTAVRLPERDFVATRFVG